LIGHEHNHPHTPKKNKTNNTLHELQIIGRVLFAVRFFSWPKLHFLRLLFRLVGGSNTSKKQHVENGVGPSRVRRWPRWVEFKWSYRATKKVIKKMT